MLHRLFHLAALRTAFRLTPSHDFRHTAATVFLGRGVHQKIVSELLGHSRTAVTLGLYSHVPPTMQREAVTALEAAIGASGQSTGPHGVRSFGVGNVLKPRLTQHASVGRVKELSARATRGYVARASSSQSAASFTD